VAIWLAIALLVVAWVFWPGGGPLPPILLVVRDRADEVEGVLRALMAGGRTIYVWDRGSLDATPDLVLRLAREQPSVCPVAGGTDALDRIGAAALLVLRLDRGATAREVLRSAGLSR